MQISYHSALTKIQKLQNLKKKKKKKKISIPAGTPGMARNWPVWPVRPVFKPVQNIDISVHIGRYRYSIDYLAQHELTNASQQGLPMS